MADHDPELLAKLQYIRALFADTTWHDAYLNESLRSAIEEAIGGEQGEPVPLEQFAEKALELRQSQGAPLPSLHLEHLNLRELPYAPLFVREELLAALKKLAGYQRALLVVSGLEQSVALANPRSRKNADRYAEALRYIDALTARFAAPGCCITILYLK